MGGSLVKAAARDGPDWDPWMPLPQGDRWMLIRFCWRSLS